MAKAKQIKGKHEDMHVYLSPETAKKLRIVAVEQRRSISAQAAYLIEQALASAA